MGSAPEGLRRQDEAFALRSILQTLAENPLPVPDYSKSLEQSYQELTIHALKITKALHLLLPAALNRVPGQPSWIPDWSADFEQFWIRPARPLSSWIADGRGKHRHNNFTDVWEQTWRPKDHNNTLVVCDYKLVNIHVCFVFQGTPESYDL